MTRTSPWTTTHDRQQAAPDNAVWTFNEFVTGRVYGQRGEFFEYHAALVKHDRNAAMLTMAEWHDLLGKFLADRDYTDERETQADALGVGIQ